MNKKKAIVRFVRTSEEWLNDLKNFKDEQIALKASENQWCLAELYDHIMRVARTYQIPNFRKCLSEGVRKPLAKNYKGFVIFDVNYLPYTKMRMESFPTKIMNDFTPTIKPKQELIEEFESFIEEVKSLESELLSSHSSIKYLHPLFGWINATEWFRLIEIHTRHHLPQRERIKNFILEQN